MALICCPECNNQVSSTAQHCPHCGYNIAIYQMTKNVHTFHIDDLQKTRDPRYLVWFITRSLESDIKHYKNWTDISAYLYFGYDDGYPELRYGRPFSLDDPKRIDQYFTDNDKYIKNGRINMYPGLAVPYDEHKTYEHCDYSYAVAVAKEIENWIDRSGFNNSWIKVHVVDDAYIVLKRVHIFKDNEYEIVPKQPICKICLFEIHLEW